MNELCLTIRAIGRVVGDYYGVAWNDIASPRRTRNVVRPRHVVMWAAKKHTNFSMPQIGLRMGGRDHTTVLHGARKIEIERVTDPRLGVEIREIDFLLDVEKQVCARMGLNPEPDLDPLKIAERIVTAPNGEFGVSLPEIRALAHAVFQSRGGGDEEAPDAPEAPAAPSIVASLVAAIDGYVATTQLVAGAKEERVRQRALNEQWAAYTALTGLSETIKKELINERTT